MPVDDRTRAQTQLILNGHQGAAAHPAPDRWDDVDDFEYLYREYAILVREPDAERVVAALGQILDQAGYGDVPEGKRGRFSASLSARGLVRLTVPTTPTLVPDLIGRLDEALGRGVAKPEHQVYVCPNACPATEPIEVPGTTDPVPPPGLDAGGRATSHGRKRRRRRVRQHRGHRADPERRRGSSLARRGARRRGEPVRPPTPTATLVIAPYAGHGTFVAGVLRCMAPKASVFVERAFDIAGADYETNLASSLEDALDRDPDILVFTFTSATHRDQSLHTFDDCTKGASAASRAWSCSRPRATTGRHARCGRPPTRGDRRRRPGRELAGPGDFSNYGRWVDVYAPGEDLINAFPEGTYVCNEPPDRGERRQFHGMAKWSGTSFSTPVVAGLIAARMSQTGENAQQAADALLRFARSQAIPGVGAVLYPGQASCEASR